MHRKRTALVIAMEEMAGAEAKCRAEMERGKVAGTSDALTQWRQQQQQVGGA